MPTAAPMLETSILTGAAELWLLCHAYVTVVGKHASTWQKKGFNPHAAG
jgi:hypothetical protein